MKFQKIKNQNSKYHTDWVPHRRWCKQILQYQRNGRIVLQLDIIYLKIQYVTKAHAKTKSKEGLYLKHSSKIYGEQSFSVKDASDKNCLSKLGMWRDIKQNCIRFLFCFTFPGVSQRTQAKWRGFVLTKNKCEEQDIQMLYFLFSQMSGQTLR